MAAERPHGFHIDVRAVQAGAAQSRGFVTRHRERHGRSLRGPILPATLPGALTRQEEFAELVADSADRLNTLWPKELSDVEFEVREVPEDSDIARASSSVPLAAVLPGPPRTILIFRHPLLQRGLDQDHLAELVHDSIVEQAAVLFKISPSSVDPGYGSSQE